MFTVIFVSTYVHSRQNITYAVADLFLVARLVSILINRGNLAREDVTGAKRGISTTPTKL